MLHRSAQVWSIVLSTLLGIVLSGSASLAQVPSAEQIELLRSLSPEDRDALLKQLGISDSSQTIGSSATEERNASRERDAAARSSAAFAAQFALVDNTLKADDTVLIDIDFIKAKPSRLEQQGTGLPPVTVPGEPAPVYEPEERIELQKLVDLVRARNPYALDRNGALQLPGFAPIVVGGLTDVQATRRLSAEPSLLKLNVKLARLPVSKQGAAGLKPFGYDLFNQAPSTFAPVTDVPVPADYVVGAGDQLTIQLYGSQNKTLKLVVWPRWHREFP